MQFFKKIPHPYLWNFVFLVFPILLLLVSQWEMSIRGSYFERQNSDPEYSYLFNALKLANGQVPNHIDHPGTTLQMFTAVVVNIRLTVKDALEPGTLTIEDVLQHPEAYLRTVRDCMAIGIAILYFLIAVQVYRKTKSALVALGFQLFPFLSFSAISALARVSVEPFLVITILFGILLLIEVGEKKEPVYPIWQPVLMGVFLGAGMVTKLTFLPFLLLVFWFPRRRDQIAAMITCIASFFLLTIPIWSRANDVIKWITGLITKQGPYGTGAEGLFPPFQTMLANLGTLFQFEPFYFVILIAFILWAVIIWKTRTPENRLERLRVSLSLGILVIQLILALKFPRPHYMLPGLIWMGFGFLMIVFKLQSISAGRAIPRTALRIVLCILFAGSAGVTTFRFVSLNQELTETRHLETQNIDAFIRANYPDCMIIPFYGASDQRYAVLYGNEWSGASFTESLEKLYPNMVSYHIWYRTFLSFSLKDQGEEIQRRLNQGECILMRGGPFMDSASSLDYNPKLVMDKIMGESYERLYRLKAILQ